MPSIIKKGTNASSFTLENGKNIILHPDLITVLSNSDFDLLMKEYGSFIRDRTLSDKNIFGCFIINDTRGKSLSQNKEIGTLSDNSSPVEVS